MGTKPISPEIVKQVLQRLEKGQKHREIADSLGISASTVSRIRRKSTTAPRGIVISPLLDKFKTYITRLETENAQLRKELRGWQELAGRIVEQNHLSLQKP